MWDHEKLEDGHWYRWCLDGAELFLKRTGEEWRTIVRQIRMEDMTIVSCGPERCDEPEPQEQSITVSPGFRAALKPVMPDRPYLLAALNTVNILEGSQAEFFVDLPAFYRLETESGAVIARISPFILSNTWFGDKTDGSLCYSLKTSLDPLCRGESIASSTQTPAFRSLIRCGILVKNNSKSLLEFKNLVVYTDLLRIWETGGYLRTDRIIVEGLSDGSLKMSVPGGHLPAKARLLSPARMRQSELLVRRGVAFLRTITGM